MRVLVAEEARIELHEATNWYRRRSGIVAQRFVAEYKRVRGLIARTPGRWPEVEPGIRRVLFNMFPYALLYQVEGDRALVLVVKHHSRHPEYWKDRNR